MHHRGVRGEGGIRIARCRVRLHGRIILSARAQPDPGSVRAQADFPRVRLKSRPM